MFTFWPEVDFFKSMTRKTIQVVSIMVNCGLIGILYIMYNGKQWSNWYSFY